MTTFKEVEDKYEKAKESLYLNRELAVNAAIPAHATWLHRPTLARWLYGASQEWVNDFKATSAKYKDRTSNQETQISIWSRTLETVLHHSKCIIGIKYENSNDKLLMEALAA